MSATVRHLFVIDPLETLNLALDSSLRMMASLAALGHQIDVCEPRQIGWRMGRVSATAQARTIRFKGAFTGKAEELSVDAVTPRELVSYQAIHMRKDPPYDLDYISTTWLLETAIKSTKIYNTPDALRRFNEKLAIMAFPGEARAALASSDADELLAFIEEACGGDGILKPLTLFGGRGVLHVEVDRMGRAEARTLLAKETEGGKQLRLAQPFDKAIYDGEVRVFTAFGEPLAWCLKKPAPGNFLANTRMGATLEKYTPDRAVLARVTKVADALRKDGVELIGFDLIGGHVSEINITSPRMLVPPGDRTDYYARLAQGFAADLR